MPEGFTPDFVWYCWIALTVLWLVWEVISTDDKPAVDKPVDFLRFVMVLGWFLYFVIWLSI